MLSVVHICKKAVLLTCTKMSIKLAHSACITTSMCESETFSRWGKFLRDDFGCQVRGYPKPSFGNFGNRLNFPG